VLVTIAILAGYNIQKNQQPKDGNVTLVVKSIGKTTKEVYNISGITALRLLRNKHDVKLTLSKSVKCIDDVCAESGYWWPMYVNGKKVSLGVNSYKVKRGDNIEFIISKR
jgi:hypothetical protein